MSLERSLVYAECNRLLNETIEPYRTKRLEPQHWEFADLALGRGLPSARHELECYLHLVVTATINQRYLQQDLDQTTKILIGPSRLPQQKFRGLCRKKMFLIGKMRDGRKAELLYWDRAIALQSAIARAEATAGSKRPEAPEKPESPSAKIARAVSAISFELEL